MKSEGVPLLQLSREVDDARPQLVVEEFARRAVFAAEATLPRVFYFAVEALHFGGAGSPCKAAGPETRPVGRRSGPGRGGEGQRLSKDPLLGRSRPLFRA